MRHMRSILATGAAVGAAAIGGGAIANAATSTSPTSTPSGTANGTRPALANMPAPGTAAHEDAEKAVTGTDATQAQAAAVKYVGSGTAGAVTTDFTGNGYEVTVTKSGGGKVEVHLDSSFAVMQGPGGPGPAAPAPATAPAGLVRLPPPAEQVRPVTAARATPQRGPPRSLAPVAPAVTPPGPSSRCSQLAGRLAPTGGRAAARSAGSTSTGDRPRRRAGAGWPRGRSRRDGSRRSRG